MRILTRIALCLLYVAAAIGLGPLLGPVASSWFIACLSFLFIWAYQWLVRGRIAIPLGVVFFVTVFFPVAVLFAIGMPVYHTWSSTAVTLFAALKDYGQFWGLELFAPFCAAVIAALALRRRSNISVKQDAPQAARVRPH